PVTEYDTINAGLTFERTKLGIDITTAPPRYIAFLLEFGELTDTWRINAAYSHDTRDSLTWPTRGSFNELGVEVGVPPGDLLYYRTTLISQWFYTYPRVSWLTTMLNMQFGYADGYHGKPLPFFKNFYAGGVDSVRGFETATLGPRDLNGDVIGG